MTFATWTRAEKVRLTEYAARRNPTLTAEEVAVLMERDFGQYYSVSEVNYGIWLIARGDWKT